MANLSVVQLQVAGLSKLAQGENQQQKMTFLHYKYDISGRPIDFSLEATFVPLLEHLDVVLGLVHVGVAHGVGEAREVVGELAAVVHLEGRALPRRVRHAATPLDLFRPPNATSTH